MYGLPLWWARCASHQPHVPADHEGGVGLAAAVGPCGFVDYAIMVYWDIKLNEEVI